MALHDSTHRGGDRGQAMCILSHLENERKTVSVKIVRERCHEFWSLARVRAFGRLPGWNSQTRMLLVGQVGRSGTSGCECRIVYMCISCIYVPMSTNLHICLPDLNLPT